ncbi:carbohydrate ABC transporter permease [Bifidobacterium colobi]|uniref:carbohydrate ABC transporter permease n=1 Tax=Bifidobacterium colobi TaxID=2809026 RepID=UPI001F0B5E44|nr:sugar ABC transporter permease [Bifidobacterium colobi]
MTASAASVSAQTETVASHRGEAVSTSKQTRRRTVKAGESMNSWQSKLRPYLFIAPLVILSGVFIYYCIGFTVATSFTDWDGISDEMDFIGLKNYAKLLAPGSVFWTALKNNIIFMVVTVVIQAGLGLILAVILKERMRGSNLFKAIFFMPIAMAPVIIAAIFRIIMDPNVGAINEAFRFLHLDFLAQSWLGDPKIALYSICAINIFEWMGFSMIIYYAGLMSISEDIYEAAKIDGCGFWNTLFRIIIPNLSGTTNTLILLGIVGSLKTFDIVIQTTGGGPGRSTEFLNTYLYKAGVQQFNGGLSAAIGVMVLIIAVVLSIIQVIVNNKANK